PVPRLRSNLAWLFLIRCYVCPSGLSTLMASSPTSTMLLLQRYLRSPPTSAEADRWMRNDQPPSIHAWSWPLEKANPVAPLGGRKIAPDVSLCAGGDFNAKLCPARN